MAGFYQVLKGMNLKSNFYILIFFTGLLFWRCSETKELNPEDLGSQYFPLETGMYRIYQVKGVQYNSIIDSVEFSYFLMESVGESFRNLENGISYKILRQKKVDLDDSWEIDSIWTARKDEQVAILVENNVPLIKLAFPLKEGKTWDGNGLNANHADEYELVNVGLSYVGEHDSFEKTAMVIHEDIPDYIVNFKSRREVYAENVGLVYKENVILNFNQDNIGAGIVDSGLKYYQHLVEYGEE